MSAGKFDAALRILGDGAVSFHATAERVRKDGALSSDYRSAERDIDDAIRVLEAAGKIDKELALRLEDCYATASVQRYGEVKIGDLYRAIRALLNALPDEAKK
jgi:hypothetical protein